MNETVREAARREVARRRTILDLYGGEKRPVGEGWQTRHITAESVDTHFNGVPRNLGHLNGLDGIVDIDLDSPEAVVLAPSFLPPTDSVFGRASRPSSHRLYRANPVPSTVEFADPTKAPGEKAMLLELRSVGTQTMIPPSAHPSGELVTWERDGEPATVAADDLVRAATNLAVASLLVRHWPSVGVRHRTYLPLAGAFLTAGLRDDLVEQFVEALAHATHSDSLRTHLACVRDTRRKLDKGEEVTGWPALADVLGAPVVKAIRRWLDVRPAFGRKTPWVKLLADAILEQGEHFAQDAGGLLHIFRDGVYQPDGLVVVQAHTKRLLAEWRQEREWSSHRASEVAEYLRVDAPRLLDQPPLDTLNLQNGLLDVTAKTLRPHDPKHLSPIQLAVRFDCAKGCPAWDDFVRVVFPEDAQALAWEIVAWLMLPDTSYKGAVLFLGEGDTGKSTYARGVGAFLGSRNIAAVPLHKLETDRFALAPLVGRLANICPDLPSVRLVNTSVFKAITGGDRIMVERKFQHPFEADLYARMLFSANHVPQTPDTTEAFFSRWLVVPFTATIARKESRHVLDKRLSNADELSGVLNRALAALPNLAARGFTRSEAMEDALKEFREAVDPLAIWLDRCTRERAEGVTPCREVLAGFNAYLERRRMPFVTQHYLGKAIKRLRPYVEKLQRTLAGGEKVECYVGLVVVRTEYEF
jgi:putative DNA primase/helicase